MNWITEMNRCTGPKDWREARGYYPVNHDSTPYVGCCICGNRGSLGTEPRFGYIVCETHSLLSPVEASRRRTDKPQ